ARRLEADEALDGCRGDEVAPATENAGGVWAAEVLRTVGDEVRTRARITFHKIERKDLAGRVDQNRDTPGVSDPNHLIEGQDPGLPALEADVQNAGGARANRVGQLRGRRTIGIAVLGEPGSDDRGATIVLVAAGRLNQDLVLQAGRVG